MHPMEAIVYQQPEDLSPLNSRRELVVKLSRRLLLAVALTSTLGWIYFLIKAARSVGAALFL